MGPTIYSTTLSPAEESSGVAAAAGDALRNLTSLAWNKFNQNNNNIVSPLLGDEASAWLDWQPDNVTEFITTSNNTTEVPYTPYENRPETYIIPIVFAIIFIVGVLGNGTLIIVFLRHRTMRNVPNT